jgi:hypothetical protein
MEGAMKMISIIILAIFYSPVIFCQVWINELSYDMSSGDTDDFIEIVGPVSTDMSTYGILLANGNGDSSYEYVQLLGTVSSTNSNNGFGFFVLLTDQSSSITTPIGITSQASGFSSIQNGDPDGVILLNHSTSATIHGIWYRETGTAPSEITRTGTGSPPGTGPYSMTGVNVTSLGESGSSAAGGSLSLFGSGNSGTWEITTSGTPGNVNTNQTSLPVELTTFSVSIIKHGVKLNWTTETEVNNDGFEIERNKLVTSSQKLEWEKIGFVEGHGNSNSIKNYEYIDRNITAGSYSYRLKQIDNDGSFDYSKTIDVEFDVVQNYELSQNHPNPFNPVTNITYSLTKEGFVRLDLYNVLGEKVRNIINEMKTAGVHTVIFDSKQLNSGIYFYKIDVNNYSQVMKMNLLK